MSEIIYYDLKQATGPVPSMATQVAGEIGRLIVSSAYAPGQLVEDEVSLAERYQVSRSVIRDAVKILVGKGLLEVRRGIGTRVRSRQSWGLLDDDVLAWALSAPPDADMLRKLMDVRRIFEPKAARWAAENASTEARGDIEAAMCAMEAEQGSVESFVGADARFHRSILRATGNEFLMALEGVIYSTLLSSIRLTNADPRDNSTSVPFHREVCDAIIAADGRQAEYLMEQLLLDAGKRLDERVSLNKN